MRVILILVIFISSLALFTTLGMHVYAADLWSSQDPGLGCVVFGGFWPTFNGGFSIVGEVYALFTGIIVMASILLKRNVEQGTGSNAIS